MIPLFFLLFQISFNPKIEIYQSQAILGEPIIAESNEDFEDIINYSNDNLYIEIEGKNVLCINLKELFKRDIFGPKKRINISNLIEEAGDYKILFTFDYIQTCEMKPLSKEEKEENERIKKEIEIAKGEGRNSDVPTLLLKLKEGKEEIREKAKKNGNFIVLAESKIKINYPIGFDKGIWQDILKESSFWERYNEKIEEILKHPESNYYPWALYLKFNNNGLRFPIRIDDEIEMLSKNFEGLFSRSIEKEFISIAKETNKQIEEFEKRFRDFPFFDEIEFEALILGLLLKEPKDEIKKRAEYIIKNSKNKKLREIAEKIYLKLY